MPKGIPNERVSMFFDPDQWSQLNLKSSSKIRTGDGELEIFYRYVARHGLLDQLTVQPQE